MRICINSRDLTVSQRTRIEEYFQENFSFEGFRPALVWRMDDSEFMLLGYPHGNPAEFDAHQLVHDYRSIMFRVHENELMGIAGRSVWHAFTSDSLAAAN